MARVRLSLSFEVDSQFEITPAAAPRFVPKGRIAMTSTGVLLAMKFIDSAVLLSTTNFELI